jgi:hypothetical protein
MAPTFVLRANPSSTYRKGTPPVSSPLRPRLGQGRVSTRHGQAGTKVDLLSRRLSLMLGGLVTSADELQPFPTCATNFSLRLTIPLYS